MASSKAALLLIPTIAASFAIPSPRLVDGNGEVQNLGSQALAPYEASAVAKVLVDCPRCFDDSSGENEREFGFDIRVLSSERACGHADVIVNGQPLAQEWDGTKAHGSGILQLQSTIHPVSYDAMVTWNTTCLFNSVTSDDSDSKEKDVTQVLTLNVHRLNGKKLRGSPSGFRATFKQYPVAEVIRFDRLPVELTSKAGSVNEEQDLPTDRRVSSSSATDDWRERAWELQKQVDDIYRLKNEVKDLQRLVCEKEAALMKEVKHETFNLKEELKKCNGIRCLFEVIYRKAHGAFKLLLVRSCPTSNHPLEPGTKMKDEWKPLWPWSGTPKNELEQELSTSVPSSSHLMQHDLIGHGSELIEWLPSQSSEQSSEDIQRTSVQSNHSFRPYSAEVAQNFSYNSAVTAFQVVLTTLGLICLYVSIRRRCIDPRHRAERLARNEERENMRRFRRAARKQAWRNWWQGRRANSDYEEKRDLILQQEAILETAMQAEIRRLQNTHHAVSSIVTAEEGRVPTAVRRSNSFPPDYRSESGDTEPPAYDDFVESDVGVADGFQYMGPDTVQYTPHGSNWTPESSVVDTSPRSSDCGSVRDSSD